MLIWLDLGVKLTVPRTPELAHQLAPRIALLYGLKLELLLNYSSPRAATSKSLPIPGTPLYRAFGVVAAGDSRRMGAFAGGSGCEKVCNAT